MSEEKGSGCWPWFVGGCLGLGGSAVIAMVALWLLASRPKTPDEIARDTDESQRFEAEAVCQTAVEQRLRSPATAKFPPSSSWNVEKVVAESRARAGSKNWRGWRFSAYVDSQNGFGAMLRTGFLCEAELAQHGPGWRVRKVDFIK